MSEEGDEVIQATPTCVESKKINVIDKDTVHKICSGQVVLNLATAIKELVENSIDAGATLVEVKLRDQGAELIEVSDNGTGVEEKNFKGMTAKYHTSKLKEFADLECIETFGFRGEALSSLCALSDMVILTRHLSAPHGTKLELNHDGVIAKQSPCARSVGTTVTLMNLFATLPVRKKDFQRNIKREFFKMCHILQAYCLVSVGVKIICTNQSKKGAKSVVLSTHGASSVLDNVTALFGPKQTAELMELKPAIGSNGKIMDLVESDFENSFALTQEEVDNFNLSRYKLEGFISSCAHDAGRTAKDRQFFFINSRPCDPKQISKLVNDDYHRYNANKHPFVFLNIKLDRSDVDVNVTPDKRQVLVNNEKILMLALKKSIMKTFGSVPSSFKLQNLNVSDSSRLLNISFKSDREDPDGSDDYGEKEANSSTGTIKYKEMFSQWQAPGGSVQTGSTEPATSKRKCNVKNNNGLQKVVDFFEPQTRPTVRQRDSESDDEGGLTKPTKLIRNDEPDNANPYNLTILSGETAPCLAAKMEANRVIRCGTTSPVSVLDPMDFESIGIKNEPSSSQESMGGANLLGSPSNVNVKVESLNRMASNASSCSSDFFSSNPEQKPEIIEIEDGPAEDETDDYGSRNCKIIPLNMDSLRQSLESEQKLRQHGQRPHQPRSGGLSRLKFKSKINPSSNKSAEEELQTEIGKEHFRQMEVIGQFNLGFIVARLEDDLFIIDQHATDEKYNFEDLQRTTVLQNQKLVIPQPLELTAVNEMVLMDNLEIFEMNGFKFELDGSAVPTRKVKLIAKPYSRNWEFGKDDIDELIFMLQDAPNTVCRPSRVRAMFASRACRKSVMIGRALSLKEMKRLVEHMGEIEQPWNCPHGRPTMRHLVNLAMISDIKQEKSDAAMEM